MTPWAYRTYKKKRTKARSSVAGFLSERAMIHFDIEGLIGYRDEIQSQLTFAAENRQ